MTNFPEYEEYLSRIIVAGTAAAKRSYEERPEKEHHLKGAIAGFEACNGKTPEQLKELLKAAGKSANDAVMKEEIDVWFWKARYAEIEWTCNVLSAVLDMYKLPVIVHPTVRGLHAATMILGISGRQYQ